jgi:hydrogenase large subunit
MKKITISPVTRISGFLTCNVSIEKKYVIDANISGTLFRGFESMLIGKYPEDAIYFTERICGICSSAHSLASARSLEAAMGITPSINSKAIRNIIHGFDILQNHLRQFYIFTLPDFIALPNSENIVYKQRIPLDEAKDMISNYGRAIYYSRIAHEGLSIFGGKAPHNHGIVFGGVSSNVTPIDIGKAEDILFNITQFAENNMQEDLHKIEKYYPEYFKIGTTPDNFLSFGLFEDFPEVMICPDKYIIDGKSNIPIYEDIAEYTNTLYTPDNPNDYNFIKAPRIFGEPAEVGPLARAIITGRIKKSCTMNRIKARCDETILICKAIKYFLSIIELGQNIQSDFTFHDSSGNGYTDTIRGALVHHLEIKDNKILNYDIITPSAWNLSSKDENNIAGPLENALIGTFIEDETNPIEIIRTIHSFDPCVSCATHIYNLNGELLNEFNYMPW